jgi:hypothetical protein
MKLFIISIFNYILILVLINNINKLYMIQTSILNDLDIEKNLL